MALGIIATDATVEALTGGTGTIRITNDETYGASPATYDLKLRATGVIPDVDFSIAGFTWTEIDWGVWEGIMEIAYNLITPGSPLDLTVVAERDFQIGDVLANFRLRANVYAITGTDNVDITFTGSTDFIVFPSTSINESGVGGVSKTIPITIQNNSEANIEIPAITIAQALIDDGVAIYFPETVEILMGQQHTFNFVHTPSGAGSAAGDISFTVQDLDPVVVYVSLTTTAGTVPCTAYADEQLLTLQVTKDVSSAFLNDLIIHSGGNSGILSVAMQTPTDEITFQPSLATDLTSYEAQILPNNTVSVPFNIEVTSDCSGRIYKFLWSISDPANDSIPCSGEVDVILNVYCDQETVCPIAPFNQVIDLPLLPSSSSGTIAINVPFDRAILDIGDVTADFTLPINHTVVTFGIQDTVAGLTWDDSDAGNNPSELHLAIDASTFVGTSFDLILDYAIPAAPEVDLITSAVLMEFTFVNSQFLCVDKTVSIFLGTVVSTTEGGFDVKLRLATAVQCTTMSIFDESTYGADANHDAEDFSSFRKIIVTLPGGVDYILGTHAPYSELIGGASDGVLSWAKSCGTGGIYRVKLLSVPTWNAAGTYLTDDCVVLPGGNTVYKSLQGPNQNYEPGSTVDWEEYWEEIAEDDIPAAYSDTQYYIQWCELTSCKNTLRRKVFCGTNSLCDTSICNNTCLMNLMKFELLEDVLVIANSVRWYDRMTVVYDDLKKLCDCSNNCK
jgi:hypothetical protein